MEIEHSVNCSPFGRWKDNWTALKYLAKKVYRQMIQNETAWPDGPIAKIYNEKNTTNQPLSIKNYGRFEKLQALCVLAWVENH